MSKDLAESSPLNLFYFVYTAVSSTPTQGSSVYFPERNGTSGTVSDWSMSAGAPARGGQGEQPPGVGHAHPGNSNRRLKTFRLSIKVYSGKQLLCTVLHYHLPGSRGVQCWLFGVNNY